MDQPTDLSGKSRPRSPFRAAHTLLLRAAVGAFAVLVVSTTFGVFQYYHSPYWNRVGLAPDQPVLFSHRHHVGELRIDCRFCHATVETSAVAGLPSTQTCLNCHSQLFADTTMLQPLVRNAVGNQPMAWSRVTVMPDHVYFDHSIHVLKGVTCVTCHGDVGRMALTAKARPLDMRWCLDCHRNPQGRLRPEGEIFSATAATVSKAANNPEPARVPAIHSGHLTNCSTCHH